MGRQRAPDISAVCGERPANLPRRVCGPLKPAHNVLDRVPAGQPFGDRPDLPERIVDTRGRLGPCLVAAGREGAAAVELKWTRSTIAGSLITYATAESFGRRDG